MGKYVFMYLGYFFSATYLFLVFWIARLHFFNIVRGYLTRVTFLIICMCVHLSYREFYLSHIAPSSDWFLKTVSATIILFIIAYYHDILKENTIGKR